MKINWNLPIETIKGSYRATLVSTNYRCDSNPLHTHLVIVHAPKCDIPVAVTEHGYALNIHKDYDLRNVPPPKKKVDCYIFVRRYNSGIIGPFMITSPDIVQNYLADTRYQHLTTTTVEYVDVQ